MRNMVECKSHFRLAGPTYNSYARFAHLPACSFDWGCGGYAGCSNYGGELLYLSAPSLKRGLIMARGNFSTSLYASLSRTQVEFGGPTTFGLEIARADYPYNHKSTKDPKDDNGAKKWSSFSLGTMIERGCFNYRWPLNEYYLDLHKKLGAIEHEKHDEVDTKSSVKEEMVEVKHETCNVDEERHVGTCQMFSFAMNHMFYQVLRIEEGGRIDKTSNSCHEIFAQGQVVLTMGGPLWLRSFDAEDRLHDHNLTKREQVWSSTLLQPKE